MAKNILHMMTPLAHMSPFDVNMAIDAGYDATVSYTNVSLDEITGLVQDAMFSRSPRDAARTGVFIGGKERFSLSICSTPPAKALFKPFEISLFADPAGSFTTAAAMIAVVEKTLREKKGRELRGAAVSYSARPASSERPRASSPRSRAHPSPSSGATERSAPSPRRGGQSQVRRRHRRR